MSLKISKAMAAYIKPSNFFDTLNIFCTKVQYLLQLY